MTTRSFAVMVEIEGDLDQAMRDEILAGERAVTETMRTSGSLLRDAWRNQITAGGLGNRLARTIRAQTYPRGGTSMEAATLVWTKAPEIVAAHDEGVEIRSAKGFFLSIPLPAAGVGRRGGRITPGEWEQRTGMRLRFIYRRRGPSLLVAEGRVSSAGRAVRSRSKTGRGLTSVPVFLLVPKVKLKKVLNLDEAVRSVVDRVPAAIVSRWEALGIRD